MAMRSVSRTGKLRAGVGVLLSAAVCAITACSSATSQTPQPGAQRPEQTVKLIFIHHSCGENWLADAHGGLGKALAANHYFVSDTNYGWGPDGIGDRTDITDWPEWFTGPHSAEYLEALDRESEQHCEYTRTASDPGGENQIVMFKSCFPNSNLEGRPTDKPARGEGLTVANAKAIYNELLKYFATRPDRLFVVVTAPPVQDPTHAANARALNTWLAQDWLTGYRGKNVAVFDFYNVLTDPGNHHRVRNGKVEHVCQAGKNTLYYPTDGDDHPAPVGNRKATEEFVPLLNHYYSAWAATKPKTVATKQLPAESPKRVMSDTEPAAADSSPPTQPPVPGTAGELIDDFERELRTWAVFRDDEKNARLDLAVDKETRHNGSASLRIQYDLAPANWATCSHVHESPQDWSRAAGLRLYLHVQKVDQPVTIVAYGGKSPDELLVVDYKLQVTRAAVDGWQQIDIPWSRFKPAEWQGTDVKQFDPHSAMGLAVAFHSPENDRLTGQLWIDDVTLFTEKPGK